jgi:hypothetical protein
MIKNEKIKTRLDFNQFVAAGKEFAEFSGHLSVVFQSTATLSNTNVSPFFSCCQLQTK